MSKIFKRGLFTFIILHSALIISAQETNLDSLFSIWQDESQMDSTRVIAYKDYIRKGYLHSNPDTAFILAEELILFANLHEYPKAEAIAYNIQGICSYKKDDLQKSLDYFQRSLKIREEIGDKAGMAKLNRKIGGVYKKKGSNAKALNYYQRSIKINEEIGNKRAIASILWTIGSLYKRQGHSFQALDYYQRSLNTSEEIGDKSGIASSLLSIGLLYHDQGNYNKASDYYQRSLKISEEIEDKVNLTNLLINIGNIYRSQGQPSKALINFQRSLEINKEIGDQGGIAISQINIGGIYSEAGDYFEALEYFQRSLKIVEEIGDKSGIATSQYYIGLIYADQGNNAQALKHHQISLKIRDEIGDKNGLTESLYSIGFLYVKQGNNQLAIDYCQKGLTISRETGAILQQKNACQCLYDAYKALGNGNEALAYHEQMLILKDSLHSEETAKALQQMEFNKQTLADSLANAEKKQLVKEAHQEEIREGEKTRNISIGVGGLILLLAVGLFARLRYVRRAKAIIEKEKDRSENLLLNILPAEIAEELKEKGKADARDFDLVSILFSDFIGFTEASAKLSARDLVHEINTCFEAFDGIMEKFKVEKIKTIGDSYMAAGGLPIPTDDSLKNTVLAALEMQAFITSRKAKNDELGKPAFEMRLGIHTGPVVAGIVGVKKFQYDIWGDTVNTASRMESTGVVGRVNISQGTYELLKDDADFSFESRGKIKAKGKGEIDMYFVSIKQ